MSAKHLINEVDNGGYIAEYAHTNYGFTLIAKYTDNNDNWHIGLIDFSSISKSAAKKLITYQAPYSDDNKYEYVCHVLENISNGAPCIYA